jgi:hypothetical protein
MIRCNNCGRFISRLELDNEEAKSIYTPDSEFTVEEIIFEHRNCNGFKRTSSKST